MTETKHASSPADEAEIEDWSWRPWVLAAWLGFASLLVHLLSDNAETVPARMAATAFVFFGALALAFTFDPQKWREPAIFAGVVGLVMAGIAWRATTAGDHYSDEEFWVGAGIIAVTLALPLFQAGFHRMRFATPYPHVHYHVWSDAISAAGSLAFTGAAWLLILLMSELFQLLKIDLLRDLMKEEWFGWTYSGAAFGAALGTLRNQLKIVGTLQQVGTVVLSILAVPLAAGLALFLVAMVISGPDVLWQATRSATPILLLCAAGAWILANAILRDSDAAMSGNRVLRWAAFALALSILPLTVFAAVSLGTRIDQHGFSPERLWGLIAIVVACIYGLAWLVALVRGWKHGDWRERLRRANLHLAALICVIALVLALPVFDFGAISARNQIGRLAAGKISAEEFDYAALRWDFGDAGRAALERLKEGNDPKVAELAQEALDAETRPWYGMETGMTATQRLENAEIRVEDEAVQADVVRFLRGESWRCNAKCTILDLGAYSDTGKPHLALVQGRTVEHLKYGEDGRLAVAYPAVEVPVRTGDNGKENSAPVVEVRPYSGRQIYVDGQPAGQPFE